MDDYLMESTGCIAGVSAEDAESMERVKRAAPQLLSACKWLMEQLRTGKLVRAVERGDQANFLLGSHEFVQGMSEADAAIDLAERGI